MSNNNKKRNTLIGVGVVVLAVGAGVGTYLYEPTDKKGTDKEEVTKNEFTKLFAYSNEGKIALYDVSTGKILDSFDLNTLGTGKKVTVQASKPVVEVQKPLEKETGTHKEVETYKDFVKVPIIVKQGDNTWNIQKSLTPNHRIESMLSLLSEVNGGKKLHPIFPNEERVFLKEAGVVSEYEQAPKAPVVETPKVETAPKVVETQAVEGYLFAKSEDLKTLYAYSDAEQTLYKVQANKGKIEAETVLTLTNLKGVSDFKVIDNVAYMITENGTYLESFNLSNPDESESYSLTGKAETWTVRENVLYYSYDDQLSRIDLSTHAKLNALIGDNTTDYLFTEDALYLLNEFGSEKDNSILVKVNPEDLKVDDLVELKTNENVILSEDSKTKDILIGQITKLTDLKEEVQKTPVVLPVKAGSLSKGLFVKDIPFNTNAIEIDGLIYQLKEDKLSIYSATNGSLENEIKVEASTSFMPLN